MGGEFFNIPCCTEKLLAIRETKGLCYVLGSVPNN